MQYFWQVYFNRCWFQLTLEFSAMQMCYARQPFWFDRPAFKQIKKQILTTGQPFVKARYTAALLADS